jgi:hypothetical protein
VRTLAACLVFVPMVLVGRCDRALATPLFDSTPSFQLPVSAFTLALGDLNDDRKADLATVNGPSQVSVRLSAGAGTFQPSAEYTTGSGTSQVVIADLNGDGNPDLVTGNSGTVSVLLGNGDGTFKTHVDYPSVGVGLAVGDVNGDGKPDVATTISVLLGNGDGTLQAKKDFAGDVEATVLAVGDLNGDGNADLVSANSTNFSVFLSHGDGTFDSRADYHRSAPAPAFRRPAAPSPRLKERVEYYGNVDWIALSDVSGDGKLDLALVNSYGGQFVSTVAIQLGRGDGTFQSRVDYRVEDYPSYVAIGDLSGDGHPDIVTANDFSCTVSVLLGHGDGTFAPHTDYAGWGFVLSVAIGDITGDGRPDLVAGDFAPYPSSVFLGNGDGTFSASAAYECGRGPLDVAIGDFDSDGKLDVATANWDMDRISILYGNGDSSLQERVDTVINWSYLYATVGDVDGDGRTDLVFANDYGTTSILLSNGDRTFRRVDVPTLVSNLPIRLGDVNGDGKLDLVTVGEVHLGDGDGSFGAVLSFDAGSGRRFALGDLNGDAKVDMVVANASENAVSVFLGNGDGTFQPGVAYGTAPRPWGIEIADLNADGKVDVVTVGTSVASVLLGRGDGTLQAHVDYGTTGASYSSSVEIADLDGDGKEDLVTNSMSVLLGNGDGSFIPATSYGPGGGSLAVGDLDRDGAPDVVTAEGVYNVLVHRNLSPRATLLSARVTLEPGTINLKSHAPWLTAYIEPVGFSASDIVLSSLRLAGSVGPSPKFASVGDRDGNGVPELAAKFSRDALRPHLALGVNDLEVTGSLVTGGLFRGTGRVRVIGPAPSAPLATVVPNPLNPEGRLSFYVPRAGVVRIRMFDRGGRFVRTLLDDPAMPAGPHEVVIGAQADRSSPLASGVYFYKIETSEGSATGRFVVLK